jgi:hypothetical protein
MPVELSTMCLESQERPPYPSTQATMDPMKLPA